MTSFALDPRLAADGDILGDGPLSRILLVDDARFPWLILVPRRVGLHDWVDLSAHEVAMLDGEIRRLSGALRELVHFDKLNVASLGNVVRQLHIHVVARRVGDAAWPGPVWGAGAREPHEPARRAELVAALRRALGLG